MPRLVQGIFLVFIFVGAGFKPTPTSHADRHVLAAYAAMHRDNWPLCKDSLAQADPLALNPLLRDLHTYVTAHLKRHDRQFDASISLFQSLAHPSNPFFKAAHLDGFGVLKEAGRWQDAKKQLSTLRTALPATFSKQEAALQLAMIDLELHHETAALRTLKNLFITAPESHADEWVERTLERIAESKQSSALFTASEWKTRLTHALDKGAIAQAKLALDQLRAKKTLAADELAFLDAEIVFKERDYPNASQALEDYLETFPDSKQRQTAMGRLATSYARSGEIDKAILQNRAIIAAYPKTSAAGWARYKIAFLEMDRGHWSDALERFDEVIRSRFKPTLRQGLWYAGWCAYHTQHDAKARNYWKTLAASFPKEGYRSLYWQAKSFESKNPAEAKRLYTLLGERARMDYYGMLALFKTQGTDAHWNRLPKPTGWWTDIVRGSDEQPTAHSVLSKQMALYLELGIDEAIPYATLGAAPRAAWPAKYPRAWRRFATDYATRFAIPESLIYAIMRQESGFQPEIRSPANATGLMQIIPPTAHQIATDLGFTHFSLDALTRPKTNLEMGSYYLGLLLNHECQGVLPFAIAAYNAGPEAVTRWVTAGHFSEKTWEEFVEAIPYSETNLYVKKVMMNYWIYKSLYR